MVFPNRIVYATGGGEPELKGKRGRKAAGDEGRAEGQGKSRPNGGQEGEKGRQSEAKEGKREPLGRKRGLKRPKEGRKVVRARPDAPGRAATQKHVRGPGGMRGAGFKGFKKPRRRNLKGQNC